MTVFSIKIESIYIPELILNILFCLEYILQYLNLEKYYLLRQLLGTKINCLV